jgi:hypothetical protein
VEIGRATPNFESAETLTIALNTIFIGYLSVPLFLILIWKARKWQALSTMSASSSQAIRYRMLSTQDDEIDTEVAPVDTDTDNSTIRESRSKIWAILDRRR